jgi:heme/copper-type cytochrome/quinol oxidase subunit 2
MAANGSAVDPSLAALFSDLAANISASIAGANSDDVNSTANRISISALIIAIAAMGIASLQVVLEYTSASPARLKCSEAAIHISHNEVKRYWSFRSWKWKYSYPDINFDLGVIIKALINEDRGENSIEGTFLWKLSEEHPEWGWYPVGRGYTFDSPKQLW